MSLNTVGVIIGRFQTDQLTDGHVELIRKVKEIHNNKVLVLVGQRNSPASVRYPLPYLAILPMIEAQGVSAMPLLDMQENEPWSKAVDNAILSTFGKVHAVLYGGRDNSLNCYKGKHVISTLKLSVLPTVSATKRRELISNTILNSQDFRKGIIYAINNLAPRTYIAVDIALMKLENKTPEQWEVLLASRDRENNKLRFPGGFKEPGETTLEAARRELLEETGLTCEGRLSFVSDYIVDDWRTKGILKVETQTNLFVGEYSFGKPTADDDIDHVKFYNLYNLIYTSDAELVHKVHRPLLQDLWNYLLTHHWKGEPRKHVK